MHDAPRPPGAPNLAFTLADTVGWWLQVRVVCSSPDGVFLVTIDEDGRCLLINKRRQALLHRFSFRGPVGDAKFSPDGRFLACGVGKVLQVGCSLLMLERCEGCRVQWRF